MLWGQSENRCHMSRHSPLHGLDASTRVLTGVSGGSGALWLQPQLWAQAPQRISIEAIDQGWDITQPSASLPSLSFLYRTGLTSLVLMESSLQNVLFDLKTQYSLWVLISFFSYDTCHCQIICTSYNCLPTLQSSGTPGYLSLRLIAEPH